MTTCRQHNLSQTWHSRFIIKLKKAPSFIG